MNYYLEYGKVYDLSINKDNCKGIYLGIRISRLRLKRKHIMLLNKPSSVGIHKYNFSLVRFKDYRFDKDSNLILNWMNYIKPSKREISYLEELLKANLNSS
jgi:hypothetical protein